MENEILKQLGIQEINPGAFCGEWSAINKADICSKNPATGDILSHVSCATSEDYQHVLTHSQRTFQNWRMIPAPKRGEIIRQIAQELRKHKDALGSLVTLETGKIKQEGDGEVQEMIDIADFSVGLSRMLYGKTMHSEREQHRLYEQWHPLGPVGVITAFNFPVAVWAWNAFIAAVAGDTVIWKPSSQTPLTAIAVQHICNHVIEKNNYPNPFSLLIESGYEQVTALTNDTRIPLISFTGSSAVGRKVGKTVAARLGKSLLELSGNNAVIVDETANLDLAVPAIVFGAVGTSGQRCTSTRRIIVHESIFQELQERLVTIYKQIKTGDPMDNSTHMGPLINQNAVATYQEAIRLIKEHYGKILTGGEVLDGPIFDAGYFVQPTLALADNHWPIVQIETFTPILYMMKYYSFPQAVAMQNAVPQGLSSSLFSTNQQHIEYFLSHKGSDCGIANINIGTSGAEIGGAFGGEKDTGGGREAGSDAWQAYMRRQTNTINWGDALPLAQGIKFDVS